MATHPKTAQSAKEAIKESTEKTKSRVVMGTGGGEPIPAGKKWTDEKRREQPKDPDTGRFTYNADGGYGLIDRPHGKAKSVPLSMRDMKISEGIKKGDVVNLGDKTWTAIEGIDYDEVKEFFSQYDEETGEYYNSKGEKLSSYFEKKKGRESKAEKEGVAQGEFSLGSVDESKIKTEFDSASAKITPSMTSSTGIRKLNPTGAQYKANAEHNAWVDSIRFNPNVAGVSGSSAPNIPEEDNTDADVDSNAPKAISGFKPPKGLFSEDGKFDRKAINYRNPAHKKFFDDWSQDIKSNPAKWGISETDAPKINGKALAYFSAMGKFDSAFGE